MVRDPSSPSRRRRRRPPLSLFLLDRSLACACDSLDIDLLRLFPFPCHRSLAPPQPHLSPLLLPTRSERQLVIVIRSAASSLSSHRRATCSSCASCSHLRASKSCARRPGLSSRSSFAPWFSTASVSTPSTAHSVTASQPCSTGRDERVDSVSALRLLSLKEGSSPSLLHGRSLPSRDHGHLLSSRSASAAHSRQARAALPPERRTKRARASRGCQREERAEPERARGGRRRGLARRFCACAHLRL